MEGSAHDEDNIAENATTKDKRKYSGPLIEGSESSQGTFDLTYRFEKPILIRGYILETANCDPENDPKDWIVDCRNIADNV